MPHTRPDILIFVERASTRSAIAVHQEMQRGMHSLASIAATAPFVGMFGTLLGIVYSFPPLGAERWTAYFATMKLLSQSLVPAEFGLLVALFTYCGCKYLHGRLDDFDREMECASLQLINQLGTTNP